MVTYWDCLEHEGVHLHQRKAKASFAGCHIQVNFMTGKSKPPPYAYMSRLFQAQAAPLIAAPTRPGGPKSRSHFRSWPRPLAKSTACGGTCSSSAPGPKPLSRQAQCRLPSVAQRGPRRAAAYVPPPLPLLCEAAPPPPGPLEPHARGVCPLGSDAQLVHLDFWKSVLASCFGQGCFAVRRPGLCLRSNCRMRRRRLVSELANASHS